MEYKEIYSLTHFFMLETVLQHHMLYVSIGMNEVWEIANNAFGKCEQKFHSKLHIESLYHSHERQIYLFVYMLSTYAILNPLNF